MRTTLFSARMWSKFVDCIRRYISNCFEESRRAVFQKNVETAIDTVHAICSSKVYQNGNMNDAKVTLARWKGELKITQNDQNGM